MLIDKFNKNQRVKNIQVFLLVLRPKIFYPSISYEINEVNKQAVASFKSKYKKVTVATSSQVFFDKNFMINKPKK